MRAASHDNSRPLPGLLSWQIHPRHNLLRHINRSPACPALAGVAFGVVTAVGSLSIDMYLPSFPAIATDLQTDAGAVQRTLSMFFIGFALGQLVYGPLSDRFGRRPPLLAGMALYVVASLICAFASNIHALQWGRLLQALGGCAGMIIPRAAVRDRCDPRSAARALSLIVLVVGAAPILAPQLGSWILIWFNWRVIFAVLGCFGVGCLIAIYFGMEETVERTAAARLNFRSIFHNYRELLYDRQFLTFSLCGGFGSAAMFAYIAGSPFVLMDIYHASTHFYGWIFGANAIGLVLGAQINARLLAYYQPRTILTRAIYLGMAGAVLLALATGRHCRVCRFCCPRCFVRSPASASSPRTARRWRCNIKARAPVRRPR